MKYTFHFSTSIISRLYLLQALTTLNLQSNEFGVVGAKAIGQALETNQVKYIFNFLTYIISFLYLLQTLISLNIQSNGIGETGAHAIGQGLETNQVRYISILFTSYHLSSILMTDTH